MGRRRGGQGQGSKPRVGDRPFRQVELRAFVHATEDPEKVRQALAFAAGFDPQEQPQVEQFDKQLEESVAQGHFRNPIQVLQLPLKRAAQVRRFWSRLLGDGGVRKDLAEHADQRLDSELYFWFRLDKQEAAMKRLRLAGGEDVVLVRAKLATYPRDRETGLVFLGELFSAARPESLL